MQLEPRQILDCSVGVMSVAITRNIWRPRDESLAACHPGSDEGRPRTNERLLWVLLPSVSKSSIGNNLISIREDSHHLMKHLTELSNISRQQSLSVCLPNRPSMSIMNIILPSMILYNLHYFIHISIWEMRCDQMWFTFEDSVLTTELSRRC